MFTCSNNNLSLVYISADVLQWVQLFVPSLHQSHQQPNKKRLAKRLLQNMLWFIYMKSQKTLFFQSIVAYFLSESSWICEDVLMLIKIFAKHICTYQMNFRFGRRCLFDREWSLCDWLRWKEGIWLTAWWNKLPRGKCFCGTLGYFFLTLFLWRHLYT